MTDVLDTLKKLPTECFAKTPLGETVKIKRGVMGYYKVTTSLVGLVDIDKVNEGMGCSKAQQAAMLAGSMFGWETPGADPDIYDEDGKVSADKLHALLKKREARDNEN